MPGRAILYPRLGQTSSPTDPWSMVDPWGSTIDPPAGTTTQGLQEFITLCQANRWVGDVQCNGSTLYSTSQILVPALNALDFHASGGIWQFNIAGKEAIICDSQYDCDFDLDVKIDVQDSAPNAYLLGASPSIGVRLQPRTNIAGPGTAFFYNGRVRIKDIFQEAAVPGSITAACLGLDSYFGKFFNHVFDIGNLNGVNTALYGLVAFNQTPGTGVTMCKIDVCYINSTQGVGFDLGYSDGPGASALVNNIITLPGVEIQGGVPIISRGQYNIWTIGCTPANPGVPGNWSILATPVTVKERFTAGLLQLTPSGGPPPKFLDQGNANQFIGCN